MTQSKTDIYQFACLKDNYGFLIRDRETGQVASIDTPDAKAIIQALKDSGFERLDRVFNTHWHPDHCGGNAELQSVYGCTIHGPAEVQKIAPLDQTLQGGETVSLGATEFKVLDLAGHTNGLLGYHQPEDAFVCLGDCLFPLGCGRMFEGTKESFWQSLKALSLLPPETLIYSAHEYTLANLAFALSLGSSPDLEARALHIRALREKNLPTVPSVLLDELRTNPFYVYPLRQETFSAQAEEFGRIRALKDAF